MGSDGTTNLPPKKDVARALLLRGSVFVHLDPRVDAVRVPPWLRRQPQLVLQVGLDMPIPIPDLRVDDEGVYGTLSFNRSPHTCMVPWESVFALVGEDGRGMVWPESMPQEIADEVEREAGNTAPPPPTEGDGSSTRAEDAKVVSLEARRKRAAATHPITRRAPDAPDEPAPPCGGGRERDDATVPIAEQAPEQALDDEGPVGESPVTGAEPPGVGDEPLGVGDEPLGPDASGGGAASDADGFGDGVDAEGDADPHHDSGNGRAGAGSNGRGGRNKRRRPLPPYLKVVK